MIVYFTNFFHPQIVTWRQISPPPYSLLTADQYLALPNPKLRFHFLDQRLKLYLALFLAIGVDISCYTLTVDRWRISPFPHILTDLVNRTCSALAILGLVGLKFHRFRLVRVARGFFCASPFSSPQEASEAVTSAPRTVPIASSIFLAASRFICSELWA